MYDHSIITLNEDGTVRSVCVGEVDGFGRVLRSNALQTYDGTAGTPAYHTRFTEIQSGRTFVCVPDLEPFTAAIAGDWAPAAAHASRALELRMEERRAQLEEQTADELIERVLEAEGL